MKNLTVLFFLLILYSCTAPLVDDDLAQVSMRDSSIEDNLSDTLTCYVEILSNAPFENDRLTIEAIKEIEGVKIQVETVKNKHVPDAMDSIITYSFHSSFVEVYKVESEQWIYNMKLSSSELKTKFGVGVNDNISKFTGLDACGVIHSGVKVLVLSESEGLTSLVFTIEKGIIKKIEYSGYMD